MKTSKLFTVERDGATLIVALPKTAVTFADEQIQAEVQDILGRLIEPSLSNVVLDFGECLFFGSAILVAMLTLRNQVQENAGSLRCATLLKRVMRFCGRQGLIPRCHTSSREKKL